MQKKRLFLITVLIGMTILFLGILSVGAYGGQVSIKVDGEKVSSEVKSEIAEGRIMLQMKDIFEILDTEIIWNEGDRSITFWSAGKETRLELEPGNVHREGRIISQMSPSPYISNGRTMIPLRAVSELLGHEVTWDDASRTVSIETQQKEVEPESAIEDSEQEETDTEESEKILDEKEIIAFDQAVEKSIQNDYSLRDRLINIRQLDEQRQRSEEAFINTRPVADAGWLSDIQNKQALLGLIQTEINLEITKLQAETDEERIEFTVRDIYHDIAGAENDLKAMQQQREVKEFELNQKRAKHEQGTISQLELNTSEEELIQLGNSINNLERSVHNLYEQLGIMTGIRDIHEYRAERLPAEHEVMDEVNLNVHSSRKASSDPYVKLQERQIELAERNLQLYVYTGAEEPYEVRRLAVQREKNSLNELKENITKTLQNRYQNIRQLENQHKNKLSEIKNLEEQLAAMKVRLDVGMVTEREVKEIEAVLTSQQFELEKLERQHQQLVIIFNSPYLVPDYLN